MTAATTNTTKVNNQVVFKNLTSVHLECLIEHPGSERVGCLNKVVGDLLQREPVAPESIEESVTLLAPGQALRPKSAAPGQRWVFRERFSGTMLFRHEITATSDLDLLIVKETNKAFSIASKRSLHCTTTTSVWTSWFIQRKNWQKPEE